MDILPKKPVLLVHICCAPDATVVYEELKDDYELMFYFYNPNIHPYKEWKARKHALYEYAHKKNLEIIWNTDYNLEDWLRGALESEPRYDYCYKTRIDATAEEASEQKFDAFTTTLLVSPYQMHEKIREICEDAGKRFEVDFYYIDFRENYEASVCESKDLELYRQKYCGCIFSERDRYLGKTE